MGVSGAKKAAILQKKQGDMKFREFVNTSLSALTVAAGNITLTNTDETIVCDGAFTVTLPPAADISGKNYYIKNEGTGMITVDADSSETIDDELTQTLNQYDCLHIYSDATEWHIL